MMMSKHMSLKYVFIVLLMSLYGVAGMTGCITIIPSEYTSTNESSTEKVADAGSETVVERTTPDSAVTDTVGFDTTLPTEQINTPEPTPTESAPVDTTPDQVGTKLSYKKDVAPIFENQNYGCSGDYCHGLTGAGGLRMEKGAAAFVNLQSKDGTKILVVPGKPEESYLYEKLSSESPSQGARMPLTGRYLTEEELKTVYNWILQGAAE